MKAISLWQPWASAIPAGLKTIETRSWSTAYRGPLAIHAAKRWTWAEKKAWLDRVVRAPNGDTKTREAFARIKILDGEVDLPRGCIVATCEIYECVSTDEDPMDVAPDHVCSETEMDWGNYSAGRFGWLLRNVQPLATPVPCIGRQGFFDWTP